MFYYRGMSLSLAQDWTENDWDVWFVLQGLPGCEDLFWCQALRFST